MRGNVGQTETAAGALVVGDKALEMADGERSAFAAEDASAFALILLRTHAPRDCGERVVFAQFCRGAEVIARINQRNHMLDLYANRTLLDAAGLRTLDASR